MTSEVTTVSFVHFEHEEKSMFVTAEVLKKFVPKRSEVKAVQPSNMHTISVAVEVSNFERSRDVNDEQL